MVPRPRKDWSVYFRSDGPQNRAQRGQHWRTQNLPPFIRDYPGVDVEFLPPHLVWAIPYSQNSGPIWWTAGRNIWQPITITGPSVHA